MSISVDAELIRSHAGERIDAFLARALDRSRGHIQRLLEAGAVTVKPMPQKFGPNYKIKATDEIFVAEAPTSKPSELVAQDIPLNIVFEDDALIVLNKPSDLVVHPAAGHADGTLVNALLHHSGSKLAGRGGTERLGIVHRLDKDTSGLMVVAKTDFAHEKLAEQFAGRTVTKIYMALAKGKFRLQSGDLKGPIGRHKVNRKKMAVFKSGGREAHTHYSVVEQWKEAALVECTLHTGRTHQIRVHLANFGHAIVGDTLYGGKSELERKLNPPRQMLHAARLGFTHPVTGKEVEFKAALPDDFKAIIKKL